MKPAPSRVSKPGIRNTMECRDIERLAELSLDGEIDVTDKADLEAHLVKCPGCKQTVSRRNFYQSQLRAKLQSSTDDMQIPAALRARIATNLQHEAHTSSGVPWRRVLPVSVVVAAALLVIWSPQSEATLDPEDPVRRHTKNLPPEVRARGSEREVHRFFEKNLAYRVAVPRPQTPRSNVRLVGARLSNIDNQDAAYVMYDHRGARISLFAYPKPRRFAMPSGFEERVVHGQPLLVGQHRGYNVVTWSQGQTVYSLVSDVDPSELIDLAVSTDR